MRRKVVVIGGGLGGLFTAAILSKEGVEVTVLEKNVSLGGGLQSFRRFGEVFDAGMHILGGMSQGGSIRRICNYLGITDRMHIRPVDDDCIDELFFAQDGVCYRIGQGRQGFVDSLAGYFPDQREALTRYVDAIYSLSEELDLFHLRPMGAAPVLHSPDFLIPVGDFIARYIENGKLRSVLAYMNSLYGGDRDRTPAYVHAIINVLYINGAYRFEGGCERFVDVLRRLIEDCGGRVIGNEEVVSVASADKLISGVTTRSGRTYSADLYISAVHPCTFVRLLEDRSVLPRAYRDRIDAIPNSYSAFMLFIKLKPGRVRYFNFSRYAMSRYDEVWDVGVTDDRWPRGVMFMTPPEPDQGEYSTKMIVSTPMAWSVVRGWEDTTVGHRTGDYEQWKRVCAEKLIDRVCEVYPDFRDCIVAVNTASPLTIRDYFGTKEGALYGFMGDCSNMVFSQVPVVTKVRNLFLTGQNNFLHGFCGVTLTAINTCEAILGTNYIINRIAEADRCG